MDVKQQIRAVGRRWRIFVTVTVVVFVVVIGGLSLSNSLGEGEEATSSLVVIGVGEGREAMVDSTADSIQVATSLSATAKSPDVLDGLRSALQGEIDRPEIADMLNARVLPGTAIVQLTVTTDDKETVVEVTDRWREELLLFSDALIGSGANGEPIVKVEVLTGTSVRDQVPVSSAGLVVTALVLALLAGTAAALMRDSLDGAVHRSEDAKKAVGLGGAPMSSVVDAGDLGPEPSRSDAILRLRARVELWGGGDVARVVCVGGADTSSSTEAVALGLAESLARSAGRAVLLDARADAAPGDEATDRLLSEVLVAADEPSFEPGVTRVSAKGRGGERVLEVLTTARGRLVLDQLLTGSDFVVVMVDPPRTSTTGQIVASYADLTVIVASRAATRIDDVEQAMRAVEEVSGGPGAAAKMTAVLVG